MTNHLRVKVIDVVDETADAKSIAVEPIGDASHFDYRPGQFLTIRIPTDWPEGAARCYSLCSAPERDEPMRVAVKRTEGGYGSNWICDNVTVGDELEVLRPAGAFTPRSLDGDFLLIAGGSGITPVLSILKSVLDAGSGTVTLVYANRDAESVIFARELQAEAEAHPGRLTVIHWLENLQGLPSADTWQALLAPWRGIPAFICGPAVFMDMAVQTLQQLGTHKDQIHVEKFTSLASDPFVEESVEIDTAGPMSTVEVTLDGETRTLDWPQSNNLLDVLLEAGLDAPYSCREGACSACACFLLEGDAELLRNDVLDAADLADGLILACQAVPKSDRLVVSYDE